MTCEELFSVWELQEEIEKGKTRIEDLQSIAESTVQNLDGMPHSKNQNSKVEKFATLIVECQKEIDALAGKIIQAKMELITKLQSFAMREILLRVLVYRYVACLSLSKIARRLGYTRRHINNLHSAGLQAIGLSLFEVNLYKSSCHFTNLST